MNSPKVSEENGKKVNTMNNPVEVKIFVTPTCPSCPDMVRGAYYYSLVSDKISTVIIMSNEFEKYSENYKITAVPTIVFNEKFTKEGQMPEDAFVNYLVVSS